MGTLSVEADRRLALRASSAIHVGLHRNAKLGLYEDNYTCTIYIIIWTPELRHLWTKCADQVEVLIIRIS